MGSVGTAKAIREHDAQVWREVLDKILDLDPDFVTRYPGIPSKEAVLMELSRLYNK
jgi:hypothetical protein